MRSSNCTWAQASSLVLAMFCALGTVTSSAFAQSVDDLREMSIEDLSTIGVTSVSKTDEPLSEAPAAIYVISHEDIVRSTAASLPEILRLAPNLQVYQQAPGKWVVTARGMNGNTAAQSFPNKLLVLVDGRTVYTPLFSGVYWDLPDVLPSDIDRVEVISGPGATLWGANAVNGVINVITRTSAQTLGLAADLRSGTSRRALGLRYGARPSDSLTWRAGVRLLDEEAWFGSASGASVDDPYRRLGANFRLDWTPSSRDTVSLAAELFGGRLGQPTVPAEKTRGRSLALRWQRTDADHDILQVQAFYDRIERDSRSSGGGRFFTDNWDIDLQHSLHLSARNRLVWGGGVRLTHYRIDGTPNFFFAPPGRDLLLANGFVQDTWSVTDRLDLRAGIKLEKDPYVPASLLPEVRVSWTPMAGSLIWAAVSRAVRSPTPFDRDVEERAGIASLSGNRLFRTEKLTAYELGLRMQPAREISFSATGFVHRYNDLRTVEVVPGPGFSLSWGNNLKGRSYGLDAWFDWRVAHWWTIGGGASLLFSRFTFKPGASAIIGAAQLGTDPKHQFRLSSSMNLPGGIELDLAGRAVAALPGTAVGGYRELDARVAWPMSASATISISGTNLLHDRHLEYPGSDFVPRRVLAGIQLAL
jgi:iron complex outermembrane recepter protein